MKINKRRVQVFGIGVLTPALTGQPQAANARSIDRVEAPQIQTESVPNFLASGAVDIGSAWSIFDFSLGEKLKMGGKCIQAGKRYRDIGEVRGRYQQFAEMTDTTICCRKSSLGVAKSGATSPNLKQSTNPPNLTVKPPNTPHPEIHFQPPKVIH